MRHQNKADQPAQVGTGRNGAISKSLGRTLRAQGSSQISTPSQQTGFFVFWKLDAHPWARFTGHALGYRHATRHRVALGIFGKVSST